MGTERASELASDVPEERGEPSATDDSREVPSGKKRKPDRLFRLIAVMATLGLVAFVVVVITSQTTGRPSPRTFTDSPPPSLGLGTKAPNFSVSPLNGGSKVELSALRGDPVVLNFFASWCANCQAELSAFATFARAENNRVHVVGVDTNDSNRSGAIGLLKRAHASYAVGVDPVAEVATRYLIEALPVTYFIDSQGRVGGVAFGQLTVAQLNSWLKRLEAGEKG